MFIVIYKIYCKDENIRDIYIGSTKNLNLRTSIHKHTCNNETLRYYNIKLYKFIRENGGWDNFKIEILKTYEIENIKEKLIKERKWIDKLKPSLNTQKPCRTDKEYRDDNKEKINLLKKINKQKYRKIKVNCNICNKELNKLSINRHIKNVHEKIKEEKPKKEKLNKNRRINCDICNLELSIKSLQRHKQRNHLNLLKNN